jgi:hypothetical protein
MLSLELVTNNSITLDRNCANLYDAYISLGDNCEAGLQLRRIGYEESSLFRFARYFSFQTLLNLIDKDFAELFLQENLVPMSDDMVKDKKYNIGFHSKLCSCLNEFGDRAFEENDDFTKIYQHEYSKIKYLIYKWNSLVNSSKKVLYILKSSYFKIKHHDLIELSRLLSSKYPRHNFEILALELEQYQEQQKDWQIDRVTQRFVSQFAPYEKAKFADSQLWDSVFADFPLKQAVVSSIEYPNRNKQLEFLECIDFPKSSNKQFASKFKVRGWAIGKTSPIVMLNFKDEADRVIKMVPMSVERQDVANHYLEISSVQRSLGYLGFDTYLDLSMCDRDRTTIKAEAIFENGKRNLIALLNVDICA